MPATQINNANTNIADRRKRIEALLHNGSEVTVKDVAWLLYDMNGDIAAIATALTALLCKPEPWAWKTARESIVKTVSVIALAWIVWTFMEFARSGFQLP